MWIDDVCGDFVGVAFQESPLQLLFLLIFQAVATLHTQVKKRNAVVDHPLLDLVVKRTVRLKRRHLVDFDEGRLQFVIYHDVESQNLEAHAILNVVWLARTVQMVNVRLRQAERLDYDLIDLVLYSFHGQ